MNEKWTHKTASSIAAPEAALRDDADWVRAQSWCNFVLFKPSHLPAGTEITATVLRPEAPPGRLENLSEGRSPWGKDNRCAHRTTVGDGNRELRIKQFLYDWAPPAYDHPCLWKSRAAAFAANEEVAWLGRDYENRVGASIIRDLTTIEVSVLRGEFAEDELRELIIGLTPASPSDRKRIIATPFAALAYGSRYPCAVVAVPVGFWSYQRAKKLTLQAYVAADAPLGLPGAALIIPKPIRVGLDSIFVYGPTEDPIDVEYLYRERTCPGWTLRVLASRRDRAGGIPFPPVQDPQHPSTCICNEAPGAAVHICYTQEEVGGYEVAFQTRDLNVLMMLRPKFGFTASQVFELARAVTDSGS